MDNAGAAVVFLTGACQAALPYVLSIGLVGRTIAVALQQLIRPGQFFFSEGDSA